MIHIEDTPNPNALKFLCEKKISSVGTQEFQKANIKKINNYFIKNLLNLDGVELVLVSENFLSVKKNEKISWDSLRPSIVSSLNDYFQKNEEPILSTIGEAEPEKKIEDNKIIDQINNILNTKIRPAVARDGGDIKFISFDNGIVRVELRGSCSGCPSSLMTLKQGVQNLLRHYVKEVKSVEAI
jgi:Fe-S cluster biogenesis protein NfuA